jgi:hypothetical protein
MTDALLLEAMEGKNIQENFVHSICSTSLTPILWNSSKMPIVLKYSIPLACLCPEYAWLMLM